MGDTLDAYNDQIRVGRVLSEDSDFVTLEVCKDNSRTLNIEDGDRFLTLVFVKPARNGKPKSLVAWNPWES